MGWEEFVVRGIIGWERIGREWRVRRRELKGGKGEGKCCMRSDALFFAAWLHFDCTLSLFF